MKVFNVDDPVGAVKQFEVGEYNDNLLPLICTKVKDWVTPINKKPFVTMSIKVEKDGVLLDILDIPLKEVFKVG